MVRRAWGGFLGTDGVVRDGLSSGMVERVEDIRVPILGLLLPSPGFLHSKVIFEMGIMMPVSPRADREN